MSLPWREYHETLPTNRELSLKRLLRRLEQEPEVRAEYDKKLRQQLAAGIVERVEPGDVGELGRVHYLPHHAVIRRDKQTTQVRVVYDASSSSFGPLLPHWAQVQPEDTLNSPPIQNLPCCRCSRHRENILDDICQPKGSRRPEMFVGERFNGRRTRDCHSQIYEGRVWCLIEPFPAERDPTTPCHKVC